MCVLVSSVIYIEREREREREKRLNNRTEQNMATTTEEQKNHGKRTFSEDGSGVLGIRKSQGFKKVCSWRSSRVAQDRVVKWGAMLGEQCSP